MDVPDGILKDAVQCTQYIKQEIDDVEKSTWSYLSPVPETLKPVNSTELLAEAHIEKVEMEVAEGILKDAVQCTQYIKQEIDPVDKATWNYLSAIPETFKPVNATVSSAEPHIEEVQMGVAGGVRKDILQCTQYIKQEIDPVNESTWNYLTPVSETLNRANYTVPSAAPHIQEVPESIVKDAVQCTQYIKQEIDPVDKATSNYLTPVPEIFKPVNDTVKSPKAHIDDLMIDDKINLKKPKFSEALANEEHFLVKMECVSNSDEEQNIQSFEIYTDEAYVSVKQEDHRGDFPGTFENPLAANISALQFLSDNEEKISENRQSSRKFLNPQESSSREQECSEIFVSTDLLEDHQTQHAPLEDKVHECHICKKTFAKRRYLCDHVKRHKKNYKCDQCETSFSSSLKLKCHRNLHLGIKDYKCHICKKGFANERYLQIHLNQHKDSMKCDQCDASFNSAYKLELHRNLHFEMTSHECPICKKCFILERYLKKHLEKHMEMPLNKCTVCDRSFMNLSSLRRHRKRHLGIKPHKCTCCNKSYISQGELNNHMRSHLNTASNESVYLKTEATSQYELIHKCTACRKVFPSVDDLKEHLKGHHPRLTAGTDQKQDMLERLLHDPKDISLPGWESKSGDNKAAEEIIEMDSLYSDETAILRNNEIGCSLPGQNNSFLIKGHATKQQIDLRPHKCWLCSAEYAKFDSLQAHARVAHMKKESYKCMDCSRTFKHPLGLQHHIERYHAEEGIAVFGCNHCDAAFEKRIYLDDHLKNHLLHKCTFCEKGFAKFCDLKDHVETKSCNDDEGLASTYIA